ncbi:MAG: ChaN family lipoprotein [Flavobacterium sp.]
MRSFILVLLVPVLIFAQEKSPYALFTKSGNKTNYAKLLRAASQSEVILFGEYHDNSVVHWLELELAKDLTKQTALTLGAEMLEADNQSQVNAYLAEKITQKQLDSLARLWPNYKTDYKPLVDWAKEKSLPFIATNVPRKYASLVYKKGFDALLELPDQEKAWMSPLPIFYDANLPGYANMLAEMGGHGGENLPKAQAIKDATMAYFIEKNLPKKGVFLHYNGTYHSDNFEGIGFYLKRALPELKIITISTVTQADLNALAPENVSKADFILVIDEDVTKTY